MGNRIERRLLLLAITFIVIQGLVLTLSPAVRERSWAAPLRYSHWLGIVIWAMTSLGLQRLLERARPAHDPYILPVAALLAGWGILTIWRLDSSVGLRQVVWLVVAAALVVLLVSRWGMRVLRRYKYVLLAGGLALTALTIFLGTSPTGSGPRLWLGCCGVYLQPSEPLKLLLVLYLAAYLSEHTQLRTEAFPLILPTLLLAGTAWLLLIVQKDLGSASLLILLYTVILYLATGRRRVLAATMIGLGLAAIIGFLWVDVVHGRVQSWLNPWADPSGASYQIVQSLLSIANGGIIGRGLGLGSPGLVPVAQSDFVYSAIAEEAGLIGSIGLLAAYALLFTRGISIALKSPDRFGSLLAAGLTAYLGVQSLLIIAGDLRILPLTGVTLPFVSYGGSSLLTACLAAAMLLSVPVGAAPEPSPPGAKAPYRVLALATGLALAVAALVQTWWAVVRSPDLLARTDNARRTIADRYVARGSLLDRADRAIDTTVGVSGSFERRYRYADLGPISGYTHPVFGQAGLEASLDPYLRGTQGNPVSMLIWDQLLYGTPPPGLDVRLSIDLDLQRQADAGLGDRVGAIVLMNARSGEVLAMASHPTFDPNALDTIGADLLQHAGMPLLNRAAQGTYAIHEAAMPLVTAARLDHPDIDVASVYRPLDLYQEPQIRMPVSPPVLGTRSTDLRISPLQMAIAAATLSNGGVRPSPRIVLAVKSPLQGWVILPPSGESQSVVSQQAATQTALHYAVPDASLWQWRVTASQSGQTLTWYVAGTLPDWQGTPLVVVVLLESGDVAGATSAGTSLLSAAPTP